MHRCGRYKLNKELAVMSEFFGDCLKSLRLSDCLCIFLHWIPFQWRCCFPALHPKTIQSIKDGHDCAKSFTWMPVILQSFCTASIQSDTLNMSGCCSHRWRHICLNPISGFSNHSDPFRYPKRPWYFRLSKLDHHLIPNCSQWMWHWEFPFAWCDIPSSRVAASKAQPVVLCLCSRPSELLKEGSANHKWFSVSLFL